MQLVFSKIILMLDRNYNSMSALLKFIEPLYCSLQTCTVILDIAPLFGFGEHSFSSAVGTCVPIWVGHRNCHFCRFTFSSPLYNHHHNNSLDVSLHQELSEEGLELD